MKGGGSGRAFNKWSRYRGVHYASTILALLFLLLETCISAASDTSLQRAAADTHPTVALPPPTTNPEDDVEEGLKRIWAVWEGEGTCSGLDARKLALPRGLRLPLTLPAFAQLAQKADLTAAILQRTTPPPFTYSQEMLKSFASSLLQSDERLVTVRLITLNGSTLMVEDFATVNRPSKGTDNGGVGEYSGLLKGVEIPEGLSWLPANNGTVPDSAAHNAPVGSWSYAYFSCRATAWVLSYTVPLSLSLSQYDNENQTTVVTQGLKGYLSFDVDASELEVNQCNEATSHNQVPAFIGTHKCDEPTTMCVNKRYGEGGGGWARGNYECRCRPGYYMHEQTAQLFALYHIPEDNLTSPVPQYFPGTLVEAVWLNGTLREEAKCRKCAPGCATCVTYVPCLATYNWPFRCLLLGISCTCIFCTIGLVCYVYHHRRLKIFKVASPIFLSITLLGCAIMYSEMGAIFPILDMYSCIATKWSRHLGFCVTYTALLMKTWRVSLTYRVKSAHKVKLTDKQLLQWMLPILLVMVIYLGTWTVSDPPYAHKIKDNFGLAFKQCSFNWWDHSLAIGEVLFLGWGIRVCYSVRNAESLFNEARLISYAIYNIAIVNIAMVAFHVFLFPRAGPDIKYLLGFIRTQLSTSTTIVLVFAPKVIRVMRGEGDQWDNRSRSRAVTASFSINGIGLVKEETADLYQENEELKEEIQKLAGQIEFMKIVSMEVNNRHLRPKTGGYFSNNMAAAFALGPSTSAAVAGSSTGAAASLSSPPGVSTAQPPTIASAEVNIKLSKSKPSGSASGPNCSSVGGTVPRASASTNGGGTAPLLTPSSVSASLVTPSGGGTTPPSGGGSSPTAGKTTEATAGREHPPSPVRSASQNVV